MSALGSAAWKAAVLRHIAREEPLDDTLQAFPDVSRATLQNLLNAIADALSPLSERPPAYAAGATSAAAGAGPPARSTVTHVASGTETVLRVHSDGASRGNPGPAGAGAVISRTNGEIVERLGKFLGRQTNNHAEYMGVIVGLRRVQELGAREVHVYADSELMIRQLGGRYRVKSETLKPLFDEAMALVKSFPKVKLIHVPREQNAEADEMSNRAIDEKL